jgi:phosphopantothenoylcysteine synthetase/decarboxylase
MRWLVTAGGTVVPIDEVRSIGNRFTGRTGAAIALEALRRGHEVTLLTSHSAAFAELGGDASQLGCEMKPYRTFDDLHELMAREIVGERYDCIVHSVAVSDYKVAGVYAAGAGFDASTGRWQGEAEFIDRRAAKVKSDEPELWLRLVRSPKLIDLVRRNWNFRGILVKFKLEVGVGEHQLLEIAEQSRRQSEANLMVANTLERMREWACIGPLAGEYQRVARAELPAALASAVERIHAESRHG